MASCSPPVDSVSRINGIVRHVRAPTVLVYHIRAAVLLHNKCVPHTCVEVFFQNSCDMFVKPDNPSCHTRISLKHQLIAIQFLLITLYVTFYVSFSMIIVSRGSYTMYLYPLYIRFWTCHQCCHQTSYTRNKIFGDWKSVLVMCNTSNALITHRGNYTHSLNSRFTVWGYEGGGTPGMVVATPGCIGTESVFTSCNSGCGGSLR